MKKIVEYLTLILLQQILITTTNTNYTTTIMFQFIKNFFMGSTEPTKKEMVNNDGHPFWIGPRDTDLITDLTQDTQPELTSVYRHVHGRSERGSIDLWLGQTPITTPTTTPEPAPKRIWCCCG